MPELSDALDEIALDAVARVAPHLASLVKSTARFQAFFKTFPPAPPERRPPDGFQFRPWDTGMKKAIGTIYDWRSKALHAGIPFPPPMCDPPYPKNNGWVAPCETIPGLAAYTRGGVWTKKQMPFGLHLFEHITRASLLGWWKSLTPDVQSMSVPQ
jgi:hypothetical protein